MFMNEIIEKDFLKINETFNYVLKKYYDDRKKEEILDCYEYSELSDTINAYDFMIGFQNYCNEECNLIQKIDNDGLPLFFKLYKNIYRGCFEETFVNENINNFIKTILAVIEIFKKIQNQILMKNLVGGGKIFDAANKKLDTLTKNKIYLIITGDRNALCA